MTDADKEAVERAMAALADDDPCERAAWAADCSDCTRAILTDLRGNLSEVTAERDRHMNESLAAAMQRDAALDALKAVYTMQGCDCCSPDSDKRAEANVAAVAVLRDAGRLP